LDDLERNGQIAKIGRGECTVCKRQVIGKLMEALNSNWHPECFTCKGCHDVIEADYYNIEGAAYCDACHQKKFAVVCFKCKQAITSGKEWNIV
jgi:hypothetical protein